MAGNMNTLMAIEMLVDAAANFDYTVTRGFEVIDVIANVNVSQASTLTPQNGASALGAAMTTSTINDIVYASTIIDAQATFVAGNTLRFVGNHADMDVDAYALVVPTTWIAG